jgi:hypothetical protein
VVAKIHIPSTRLEKFEKYTVTAAAASRPKPIQIVANGNYQPPELFANVRPYID